MVIGIPKEIKDHEYRVALTPDGASELIRRGHRVWVESQAGIGSGFPDDEYARIGAVVTPSKDELFRAATLIVKVKDPLVPECTYFAEQHTLFTYLHLAASKELTLALMKTGCTAIAYETVEDDAGGLPILRPMSAIAGKMAVQIGAHFLEREQGGRGILLGGVPGVVRGHIVILGSGVVGAAATQIAVGMGAAVTVISLDHGQLYELDRQFPSKTSTLYSTREIIDRIVPQADLLIGAIMVKGAKTPRIVREEVVRAMRTGAVIVDVAIDQGGCVETIRPTTHSQPVYVTHGVVHYAVTNIPGIVPRTSTMALTNATLPFIVALAEEGVEGAIRKNPGLARGVNVKQGRVTYQAVADAHALTYQPIT